MRRLVLTTAALLATSLVVGCGDTGVKRLRVSGRVTHQGEPIPLGKITFQPDRDKGNAGPMGVATIAEGRFETKPDHGMTPGPQLVTIYGYTGLNVDPEYRPLGDPLFSPYSTHIELDESSDEESFDVP